MDNQSMIDIGKALRRHLWVKRGLVVMMMAFAATMSLTGCGESEQEKQERVAAEARYKEKVREFPPTADHPRGLVEFKLNARIYRIPKEFLRSRDDAKQAEILEVLWPDMKPLPDPIKKRSIADDVVTINLDANNWDYHPRSDEQLEETVRRIAGEPVPLRAFPELQEYPALVGQNNPHYRPIDLTVRRADGLPAYFECVAQPISKGFAVEQSPLYWKCRFAFGWPDGVTMDLEFPRKHFKDWKLIHDRVMTWFESFRVLDVPTERLYPSYHDGQIGVPKPGQPAFRLE